MGFLSRFLAPAAQAEAPRPVPGGRWRRGDFRSTHLGESEHAVKLRGRSSLVLPAFVVEFVYSCDEFRTLDQHVDAYAEKHGWEGLQADNLRAFLPQLEESQMLVSAGELQRVVQSGGDGAPAAPAPISALGISTGGDRLEMVLRCLTSFHENLRAHGREAELLVTDNSPSEQQTARCREALAAWQRENSTAVRFIGAAEKRALVRELTQAGACSPEVAEFALFDPLGAGFSCGANRNALLLQEAGRMFCSLDDDVVCRLSAPPEGAREGLSFFSDGDPYSRWLFPDRGAVRAAAVPAKADYLATHEKMLGLPLSAISVAGGDFTDAGDTLIRRLMRRPARVRATFLGHAGDPGIPSSTYYLYYRRENRRRLTQSAEHYDSVFPSRAVIGMVEQPRVGDASISPGMAMGLDHRTLLPPFFPVMHAEDFSFGAALWQCCPDAVLGHLPLAIAHEPPEGKAILTPAGLREARPFLVFEFAHLLRRLILRADMPAAATAEHRMVHLGRYFSELGGLPAEDFLEVLRREALAEASDRIEYLGRRLAEDSETPDFWRHDVENLIDHLRESVSQDGSEIPLDLPVSRPLAENRAFLQKACGEYGALLQAWPAMVSVAMKLPR